MTTARLAIALCAFASLASSEMLTAQLPTGPKTPTLLRADEPTRTPGSATPATDPSLANAYNSVRGGVNLNGVGLLGTPDPGSPDYSFFCTASRIGPRTVIAAAHCVTDEATGALLPTVGQTQLYFYGPGSTNTSTQYNAYQASSVVVRPEWHGFDNPLTQLGYDIALINFNVDLPGMWTTYLLNTALPTFQTATIVGDGTYGNGTTGGVDDDFRRRSGENRVDDYDTVSTDDDYNILYTDFDDGTTAHDAFCYLGICDTGRGAVEAGTAPGDSGGPLFIDGKLAGITSFGTYLCTQTMCPASPPLANASVTNGYGSIQGFAGIRGNYDFIEQDLDEMSTPEPGSLCLLATGLFGLVVHRRRRR